jgi:response regulator RpfG family c-di-GMP phosphodiesterase
MGNQMIKQKVYCGEVKDWDMKQFYQSSQLHDVGKIAIRDNILSDEALEIIKQGSDIHFDPFLVEIFEATIKRFSV